jgi:hypothetical protein
MKPNSCYGCSKQSPPVSIDYKTECGRERRGAPPAIAPLRPQPIGGTVRTVPGPQRNASDGEVAQQLQTAAMQRFGLSKPMPLRPQDRDNQARLEAAG